MSEKNWDNPPFPENSEAKDALYQGACLELLSTCLEHMKSCAGDAEPTDDISGGYYLESPSSYDLPEWDCIDVEIFPKNAKDKHGNSKLLRIEFIQDITDRLMLIERYTLVHDDNNFVLARRFRLYDATEKNGNIKERNISPEQTVSKEDLDKLNELIYLSKTDELAHDDESSA